MHPASKADIDLVAHGVLTVREAAAYLRVSVGHIYDLMERGDLVWTRSGRLRRIPVLALHRHLARNLTSERTATTGTPPDDDARA